MKTLFAIQRAMITAGGMALACLTVAAVSPAQAGLFHARFTCLSPAAVDDANDCLNRAHEIDRQTPNVLEQEAGMLGDPAILTPAVGDPDSGSLLPMSVGGPGANGQASRSGHSTSFGSEGSFNLNRVRLNLPTGLSGLGMGGGGGVGGGGGGFFAGGLTPLGSTTSGGSTGDPGGGTPTFPAIGSSFLDPILPDPGTTYVFHYGLDPGGLGNTSPLFFDPPLATGYNFQILSGPDFASVEIPARSSSSGTEQFTLTFGTFTESLVPGTPFFFTSVDPGGITQFRITGNFDPNGVDTVVHSLTLDTAITFVGGGQNGSFSQTPIISTPEPDSLTLLGLAAAALFARHFKRRGWRW